MADDEDGEEHEGEPDAFDDDNYGEFLRVQRATFSHQLPDVILELYVSLVNNFEVDISFGMTVMVNGSYVAGDLISVSRFFRETAARAEEGAGVIGRALTSPLRETADEFDAERSIRGAFETEVEETSGAGASKPPLYIHLANASMWTPGTPLSAPVGLWRIRLSHVSGWAMGRISDDDH